MTAFILKSFRVVAADLVDHAADANAVDQLFGAYALARHQIRMSGGGEQELEELEKVLTGCEGMLKQREWAA